jgi:broad specificity phosphatase PhoE
MNDAQTDGTTVTRWWWVRHAPVTTDGGRIYGQTDVPADTSDTACYPALARALPETVVLITSHLRRTTETAAAIAAAGRELPEAIVSHAFAEQNFGAWQGQPRAEIRARHGHEHGLWLAPADVAPPGGESFADLADRVGAAIDEFNRVFAGADILAVAHGGTIRAAIGHALGLPADRSVRFAVDNCSLTRLDHIHAEGPGPAWRVDRVNSTPWR